MRPPYCGLAEYLVDNSERDLRIWLLSDYKEGNYFPTLIQSGCRRCFITSFLHNLHTAS